MWFTLGGLRNVLDCGSLEAECTGMWFNSDGMYWNINHLRWNLLEYNSLEVECIGI